MKNVFILLVAIVILSPTSVVYAAKNEAGAQNTGAGQQAQQQTQTQQQTIASSPTDNQVQNQNKIQTQNQGEDSQLQVNTQEQENLGDGQGEGLQNRNQKALENMSNVAKQVQQLLQVRTTGGIGEQVRQIAQEQKQTQDQIKTELGKIDSRGGLLKKLIGPDYKALKKIQKQMDQNQLRIQQLEQLQNQLTNQGDITMVQEAIQALAEQNTALQDKIALENQSGSLFGWLFKSFAK